MAENYYGRKPDKLRSMVLKLNEIGISRLKQYVKENHSRENFDRNIEIIKYAARNGYSDCAVKFFVSRQCVEQLLKRYYRYACECEGDQNG